MQNKDIKVGDLVETCSLMPGVVMIVDGDDIEVRSLQYDNGTYNGKGWSCCSLRHCGIVPLTALQALRRLQYGKVKLARIWDLAQGDQELYANLIDEVAKVKLESRTYNDKVESKWTESYKDLTYHNALEMLIVEREIASTFASGDRVLTRWRIVL